VPFTAAQILADSLNTALEKYFPAAEGVEVIAEPGRYFAEPGMTLFTRVFGKRVRTYHADADTHYYWISDGAYGSMNCILYDHAVISTQFFPVTAAAAAAAEGTIVVRKRRALGSGQPTTGVEGASRGLFLTLNE
jgi:ornithine decarboxylase